MAVNTYRASVPSFGEGSAPNALASRRAETVVLPFYAQWALEGRLFMASEGGVTTPITATQTAITALQPEFAVRVPDGTTILPLYAEVVMETMTASVVHEVMFAAVQGDIGNGTSSAVTNAISNLLVLGGKASNCVVRQAYTGNATAATTRSELMRFGTTTPATVARYPEKYAYNASEHPFLAVLRGPATFEVHVASATTAPNVFIRVIWAEFLSSELGY